MVKITKFRNPQCANITSREMFETANHKICQRKKNGVQYISVYVGVYYQQNLNIAKKKKGELFCF